MSDSISKITKGPYFSQKAGLSYQTFGELLHFTREFGPGRYPIDGTEEHFHLIIYQNNSWRVTTPQLDLFSDYPEITLETQIPGGKSPVTHTLT